MWGADVPASGLITRPLPAPRSSVEGGYALVGRSDQGHGLSWMTVPLESQELSLVEVTPECFSGREETGTRGRPWGVTVVWGFRASAGAGRGAEVQLDTEQGCSENWMGSGRSPSQAHRGEKRRMSLGEGASL